jgi:hypothetical protein
MTVTTHLYRLPLSTYRRLLLWDALRWPDPATPLPNTTQTWSATR